MKTFGKNELMTALAAFLLLSLTACGTTVKNYTLDSNPKGVLVVAQPKEGHASILVNGDLVMRETKGRQTGNLLLSAVGPAVSAMNRSYIYDPAAFQPYSATKVFIYVIDAKTSEVVHIEQRVFPDITNGDALKALAGAIGKFPVLDEKTK